MAEWIFVFILRTPCAGYGYRPEPMVFLRRDDNLRTPPQLPGQACASVRRHPIRVAPGSLPLRAFGRLVFIRGVILARDALVLAVDVERGETS